MSASRRAATVVLVTVALTAGPAAGAAAAAVPLPTDTLTCTRESGPDADSGAGSDAGARDTGSSSGGATGSPQLDPKTLEQAQELVDQTRALLTTLIGSDDPRAATLVQEFRAMGFTPAVATGWRQRAHDLADALMTNTAPAAQQLAVVFAAAGFSPTPADLRRGPANAQPAVLPRPAQEATANAVPAVAAAAPAGDSTRAGGAMSAVISQVTEGAELAADSAAQNGPAPQDSSGVQVCHQDSSAAAAGGTGTGGTAEAQAWAQDVHDLAQELAQQPDDPDAQAFADKLRDAGFDAQPDVAGNNVSSDVQTRGNTASGDSTQDTDSDSDSDSDSGASAQPSNGSAAATPREGGLDEQVATLSQALAQAQDDPTAQALADKLAEAGFPQADEDETGGSARGSAGSSAPDRALGGDSSSSPGGGADRSSGDRRPRGGAPDNDPAEDSSDSRDRAVNADSGQRSGQDADSEERQDDERQDADRGGEAPAVGSAPAPAAAATAGTAAWDRLAECESGGDWSIDTGNGYSGVIRTDDQQDDGDHCPSGLGEVLAGIWMKISATLISRSGST